MSRYKWVLLGLLVGFWGLVGINRLGITYLFPVIRPEFHMSLTQLSFLIGGTSVTGSRMVTSVSRSSAPPGA